MRIALSKEPNIVDGLSSSPEHRNRSNSERLYSSPPFFGFVMPDDGQSKNLVILGVALQFLGPLEYNHNFF
jgi:hypothetical protein